VVGGGFSHGPQQAASHAKSTSHAATLPLTTDRAGALSWRLTGGWSGRRILRGNGRRECEA
jgi:hypothetical protein